MLKKNGQSSQLGVLVTVQVMQECYAEATVKCWSLWVPLQVVTFSVVPQHLRVLFVSGGCVVWNAWLDWISHRPKRSALCPAEELCDGFRL